MTKKLWSLKISSVQRADRAVYLCAARLHNAAAARTSVTETGSGTSRGDWDL